ncbi:MAG: hypothetical protein ACERKO_04970, partial [Acetanaerobacterium sp.]
VSVAGQSNLTATGTAHTFTITEGDSYTATVFADASGYESSSATSAACVVDADDLLFAAGKGTSEEDAYLVKTATQFNNINSVAGSGYYYKQAADLIIDATHRITGTFTGKYDGNDMTITINISGVSSDNVGLFSVIGTEESTVKNINISSSSTVVGANYVGMIAGVNNGTIDNCVTAADSSVTGTSYVGGICGDNTGTISNCTYSGHLYITGTPATEITAATAGFGLIAGVNTGTFTDNIITNAENQEAIGEAGVAP